MRTSPVAALMFAGLWTAEEATDEKRWVEGLGLRWPGRGWESVAPTACYRHPPKELDKEKYRRDLPVLRVVIERAYVGWEMFAARGWDWERWFAGGARFDELMAFQLDNHTGPCLAEMGPEGRSQTAFCEQLLDGPITRLRTRHQILEWDNGDPARRPRRAWLYDKGFRAVSAFAYPARLGRVEAIESDGRWWPITVIEPGTSPASEAPAYEKLAADVGYLRIPTLSLENSERLRLWRIEGLPRKPEILIVDLRGNGGGTYRPAAAILEEMVGEPLSAATNLRRKHSALTPALRWGFLQAQAANLTPPLTPDLRRAMQFALDAAYAPPAGGICIEEEKSPWVFAHRRPFARPVRTIVLADNGCGSDGEALAYILARLPGTVLAGSNTFGSGQFTQPGYFVLPHCRVPFRVATGASDIYGDGRSFDGYGLNVDILLPALPDLVEFAAAVQRLQNQIAG